MNTLNRQKLFLFFFALALVVTQTQASVATSTIVKQKCLNCPQQMLGEPPEPQTLSTLYHSYSPNNDGVNDEISVMLAVKVKALYERDAKAQVNAMLKVRAFDSKNNLLEEKKFDGINCEPATISENIKGYTTCKLRTSFDAGIFQVPEEFYEIEVARYWPKYDAEGNLTENAGKQPPDVFGPRLVVFVTQSTCDACGVYVNGKRHCTASQCAEASQTQANGLACAYKAPPGSLTPCMPASFYSIETPMLARGTQEAQTLNNNPQNEEERRQRALYMMVIEEAVLDDFLKSNQALYEGKKYTVNALIKMAREKGKKEYTNNELKYQLAGVRALIAQLEAGKPVSRIMRDWTVENVREQKKFVEENIEKPYEDATENKPLGETETQLEELLITPASSSASSTYVSPSFVKSEALENLNEQEKAIQYTLENPIVEMLFEKETQKKYSEADEAKLLLKSSENAERNYDYALAYHHYNFMAAAYGLNTAKERAAALFEDVKPPGVMTSWWWNCLSPLTDVRFLPLMLVPGAGAGKYIQTGVNLYFTAAGTEGIYNSIQQVRQHGATTKEKLEIACGGVMIAVGVRGLTREALAKVKEIKAKSREPQPPSIEVQLEPTTELKASKLAEKTDADALSIEEISRRRANGHEKATAIVEESITKIEVLGEKNAKIIELAKSLRGLPLAEQISRMKAEIAKIGKKVYAAIDQSLMTTFEKYLKQLERDWKSIECPECIQKIPEVIEKIKQIVAYQHLITGGTPATAHGLFHLMPNLADALKLAKEVHPGIGARERVVITLATLLHDIGYTHEMLVADLSVTKAHPQISPVFVKELLGAEFVEIMQKHPDMYAEVLTVIDKHQKGILNPDNPVEFAVWVADEMPRAAITPLTNSPSALFILKMLRDEKATIVEQNGQLMVKKADGTIKSIADLTTDVQRELQIRGYSSLEIDTALAALKQADPMTFNLHYSTLQKAVPSFDRRTGTLKIEIEVDRAWVDAMRQNGLGTKYLEKSLGGLTERGVKPENIQINAEVLGIEGTSAQKFPEINPGGPKTELKVVIEYKVSGEQVYADLLACCIAA